MEAPVVMEADFPDIERTVFDGDVAGLERFGDPAIVTGVELVELDIFD